MRILLIDPSRGDSLLARKALESAGHTVEAFTDPTAAVPALAESRVDAAVVDWTLPGTNGIDWVQRLRAAEKDSYLYVVMSGGRDAAVPIDAAFQAGVDDFIRKPLVHTELLARLGRATRLDAVARVVSDRAERRRAAANATARTITGLRAWDKLLEIEQTCLGDFMMCGLGVATSDDAHRFSPTTAAAIPFSLPSENTELRFFIEIDQRSLEVIGSTLFGDASVSEGTLADLLLEMANTVGGTFMRHAVEDGVSLTTGLPRAVAPAEVRSAIELASCGKTFTFALSDSPARVRVSAVLRTKQNVRVPTTRLREGMILVADVHSPGGMLLIRGGTRITSTACSRLAELLGGSAMVEVADTL